MKPDPFAAEGDLHRIANRPSCNLAQRVNMDRVRFVPSDIPVALRQFCDRGTRRRICALEA